jgi:hypothetical protein
VGVDQLGQLGDDITVRAAAQLRADAILGGRQPGLVKTAG